MAAAATEPLTFPLFTSLPRELRDQIWRNALADDVRPASSRYRKGCWCPRRLSESDEEYDHDNDKYNLLFEFRHDLLDDIRFEIALFHVSLEARDLTLAWIREQGMEIRPYEDRSSPVFVRPFDPKRDALYIPLDQWDNFLGEPNDRLSQPDLFGQFSFYNSDLTRVAVPAALLRSKAASLPEIFRFHYHLKVLLIVVDPPPDPRPTDDDVTMQYQWDFESVRGGAFFWHNHYTHPNPRFNPENDGYVGDEAVYRLVRKATRGLGKALVCHCIERFEVRLVFAVRR
ncbi:hypothetical protein BDR22DRAFT_852066 [Usnea florida]